MLAEFLARLRTWLRPSTAYGLRVARAGGLDVWVHWWLLLVVGLQLVFYTSPWSQYSNPLLHFFVYLLALPASVVLHELGHLAMARREGGGTDRLVLLPVGGLVPCDAPESPGPQGRVAAGGLLASLTVLLAAGAACRLGGYAFLPGASADVSLAGLLAQYLILWSLFLLLVNLVPCHPLDGSRVLVAMLRHRLGDERQASALALGVSRVAAVACLLVAVGILVYSLSDSAFVVEHPLLNSLIAGFLVVGFLHFHQAHELRTDEDREGDEDEGIFGYDFSQGYTSLEQSVADSGSETRASSVESKVGTAREERARRRAREEAETRERVDELLLKIHQEGMDSLRRSERRFLKRASRIYRRSPRSGDD